MKKVLQNSISDKNTSTALQMSILFQFCQHATVATGFLQSSLCTTRYSLLTLPEGLLPGLTSCLVQEIGQKAAHDRLVTYDQHVLLTLQLHDHWLQSLHQVLVGLSSKNKQSHTRTNQTCTQQGIQLLSFCSFSSLILPTGPDVSL